MTKKILSLLTLLMVCYSLFGCVVVPNNNQNSNQNNNNQNNNSNNNNNNNDDEFVEEINPLDIQIGGEDILVNDNELTKFDRINFFNNRISITGSYDYGAGDPFILRHDGTYYLYVTSAGSGVITLRSTDLINWTPVSNGVNPYGYSYHVNNDPKRPVDNFPFAPEVFYFNGKFYMTISPQGNGHYILESNSPQGPFYNISGNIGMLIDGHHFMDGKDEKIYFFASGTAGLNLYEMEDNMYTVKPGRHANLMKCTTGNWTEGPYMLQRNGNYYLTYTGTHLLSESYRVEYAYADKNSDILKNSSLKPMDTIALSTRDDFRGLGHSSTVLGPDLDSYYLVYHNLAHDESRDLNFSRLSFNGSVMVADAVQPYNIPSFNLPEFQTRGLDGFKNVGSFLLSDTITSDTFSVEYNVAGQGDMIFSYIDNSNYSYINFSNNVISIKTVIDGDSYTVHEIPLIRKYSTNALHTFRLQYSNGKLSLYFDSMEKAYDIECEFKGGKVGYRTNQNFSRIGYTAASNVALGSSDKKAYNTQVSLANAYDEKLSYLTEGCRLDHTGNESKEYVYNDTYNLLLKNEDDRATYRTYFENETYSIEMRVPSEYAGTTFGLRIDGGPVEFVSISDMSPTVNPEGDMYVSLGKFRMSKGQHHISICNLGEEIAFSEIRYVKVNNNVMSAVFNSSFNASNYYVKNNLNLTNNGFETREQAVCGIISKTDFFDFTMDASLVINSLTNFGSGYVGLVFNSTAYAHYPLADAEGIDFPYPYCGFLLTFERDEVSLRYVEFRKSKLIETASYSFTPGQVINVRITQYNNNYIISIDGEELMDVSVNVCPLSGGVGAFAQNSNAYFKSISVRNNY